MTLFLTYFGIWERFFLKFFCLNGHFWCAEMLFCCDWNSVGKPLYCLWLACSGNSIPKTCWSAPRRYRRQFTCFFSTWYLNAPARGKMVPQHVTVPGHLVSSTTSSPAQFYFLLGADDVSLILCDGLISLSTVLKDWSFRPTSSQLSRRVLSTADSKDKSRTWAVHGMHTQLMSLQFLTASR